MVKNMLSGGRGGEVACLVICDNFINSWLQLLYA